MDPGWRTQLVRRSIGGEVGFGDGKGGVLGGEGEVLGSHGQDRPRAAAPVPAPMVRPGGSAAGDDDNNNDDDGREEEDYPIDDTLCEA